MRALFFLLVLVNLLFYGWHAGYIGPGETAKGEGERLSMQITPEKIRVLTQAEADKLAEAGKGSRSAACLEWGTFPQQEADKASEALAALNLGNRLSTRQVEETAGWWVFMPPQGNKANADKKVEELKRFGVTDFFIVQEDGPNKFAISLGVFRTEEAARNYLAALNAKGVKTARADQRETKVQKTQFRMTGLDEPALVKFDAIKKDFPGHDTRDCAPPEDSKGDGKAEARGDIKSGESKSEPGVEPKSDKKGDAKKADAKKG